MKAAIVLAAFLATSSSARAGDESSGIVGKWTWTRAENNCTEAYDYRPDGTLFVESGAEKTDNTYAIASSPDQNGFFKRALKIVKDYGGKDCADSDEDSSGQDTAIYILFQTSRPMHAVCRNANLDACYGPLHRLGEE